MEQMEQWNTKRKAPFDAGCEALSRSITRSIIMEHNRGF